ncbi:unnamed protein product [Parascedosporium putredinis]|uniref:ATP-dependent RNA helicase n=1 Tax=Parascedosporium putredinis TaxID=1442378 RepID=A0A9P1H9S2_9PEZI|nr:unnamed protein product [Parascedosporium putredinis]CAI8001987.1 unnamed protein product [Parascedosporium putredinis]
MSSAKRKRTSPRNDSADEDDDDTPVVALPTVDFFSARSEPPKPAVATAAHEEQEDEVESEPEDESTGPQSVPPISEDECRQILRSHRLKFSYLIADPTRPSRVEKKPRKRPRPLISFHELRSLYGVPPQLCSNLASEGYKIPTEVQMASLPLLLRPGVALREEENGGDLDQTRLAPNFMAVAPTGSGKTMSFLIPAVTNILKRRQKEGLGHIHELEAVVIAPTRELAFQIMNEGRKLVMGTGLRVVLMKKGMEVNAERSKAVSLSEDEGSGGEDNEMEDGDPSESENDVKSSKSAVAKPDILITTPAPLLNFLTKHSKSPKVLPSVRTLVLDEADVLLDPIFIEQTAGVWSACTNPSLHLTFWSATMGSNIESLVQDRLESGALAPRAAVRLVVGLKDTAVPNITHKLMYTASENGKLLAMRQLLRPRSLADPSATPSARHSYLHSGLSDGARASIMRRFRAGEIWVLITTDVLARGVDFAGVNGIVNYDVPTSAAAYVHRAGRTGRAGREGVSPLLSTLRMTSPL